MEENLEKKIELLKQWMEQSDSIVFFGGAGVSTESGIPDFRSVDGLYNQTYKYPPETIISHSFYVRNPQEFYRFYKDRMLFPDAKPNRAHLALAKLEQEGKSFEELEYLTLGTLRTAVMEGDVTNGTVMAGQIAGMISKEQTCKEMIEEMMAQASELMHWS